MYIKAKGPGEVRAGNFETDSETEIIDQDQIIMTLDGNADIELEANVNTGKGYVSAEVAEDENKLIGEIKLDAMFSPVKKVSYKVENSRVGQVTDYDKLILEVETNGAVTPDDAVNQASQVLIHQLEVFVNYDKDAIEFEEEKEVHSEEQSELKRLLAMSVNEIELSVRAANCLNNANITTVGQLATKSEADMLKYRNFGKKSLNEIKDKLVELGLGLGMTFDESVLDPADLISKPNSSGGSPSILFEDDGEPIVSSSFLD